jgi:hypothetical protein
VVPGREASDQLEVRLGHARTIVACLG